MPQLLILRHGKAAQAATDFERPLSADGVKSVRRLAEVLTARVPQPERVLCSPARRTRDTLALLTGQLVDPSMVEYPQSLYLASAEHLLSWVVATPDDRQTLLLVGHNPGVSELVHLLADTRMQGALEAGTLVHLRADVTWSDWRPASASVAGVHRVT